jgi:Ni/Co efflux regulator RcnB
MRYRKFAATVVALAVGASGAAFGQGNPRMEDYSQRQQRAAPQIPEPVGIERALQQPPQSADQRGNERAYRGDPRDANRGDPRAYQRGDYRGDRGYYPGNGYRGDGRQRGAGPSHSWYRGDRLPPEYRSRHYVVDDWRGHHLSAPPSGYHWVQAGGDYVLAAIATGVIAAILLNQ